MAIPHSPISISTSSRAIDKCLEEAQFTGELILTGRKLKEFPKNSTKYDLSCTLTVDLSRNKLGEFPQQLEHLSSVEMLKLSHNVLKSIPPTITRLSNLVCLNLNCNFLSTLPSSLGGLVNLEILLLSNNKLVSIPEEICLLRNLMQLDVSCNQLAHLPPHLGSITSLKSLNLRQNLLVELPTSISLLNLKLLDFSSNRISRIPVEFGRMDSLEVLLLGKNPLVSPHANVCSRGLVHVLKMLNNEAAKDEKRRSHLSLHGNSPRFGNRKFAGSTSCLSFGSSVSPSLSSSSSFSSRHAPHVPLVINSNNISTNNNNNSVNNNPASLPPQPSKGSRYMSRSFKGTSGDEVPMHHINGALFKHQRSSSYASGMFHELPPPFANGFSHYDGSTLGGRKLDFDSFSSVRDDGADRSVVVEGCQDEVDETRKMATKLMDGTRRRRLSQGVDREELPQTAHRTNASHDNNNCSFSMVGPHQNGRCSTSSSSSSSSGIPQSHHPHNSSSNTLPSVHPKNILPLACRKALESMTQHLNDLEPGFTFRRTCRAAREEGDLIKRMQQVMESTLKVKLPSDPRASLRDGVLLCCLVNQLFPDTIPVIHTPPHPKADLSVAKCRLNVDNFLVSCHIVGLSKSQICSAPSILDERSLPDVARTVLSLVNLARGQTSV